MQSLQFCYYISSIPGRLPVKYVNQPCEEAGIRSPQPQSGQVPARRHHLCCFATGLFLQAAFKDRSVRSGQLLNGYILEVAMQNGGN